MKVTAMESAMKTEEAAPRPLQLETTHGVTANAASLDGKLRNMNRISWISVVISLISSVFLFALDNKVVADVQPSTMELFGDVDKLPWVSVLYLLGVIAFNLLL
ncbi:hypothetical protein M501DRAFT_996115 [Patellaria atrata CBS 101060]|uniref:Major facilitator superfamily (MFS) profile domain-containing protein n=1 Tax=Patellaria atrata CBS 101060 TaxID=1346257 RepID=A0A9P4VP63_9PEZI|nr:hypothetical protein M501DRAFT_996115 [Patellaria atrata CBS 101060]